MPHFSDLPLLILWFFGLFFFSLLFMFLFFFSFNPFTFKNYLVYMVNYWMF